MRTLAKWSVEDYHRMIEAGILSDRRVELIEGEIIEMSPEGPLHVFVNDKTAEYLRQRLKGLAKIREAHPITLANSEPEPDIAIVRLPDTIYLTRHPYPEDIYWLIEIADSTVAEDLRTKKKIYARAEIAEYWVIDVQTKKITIFRQPQEDNYLTEQKIERGTITPLAFSHVAIEVNKLF
ncbi:Uma2 family endonuclease [Pleurocapsales cyanobacterium LEGE 06147]|nr:Uma2 family endonuclease [Pleurocapsales cyanobacterium LEGE 06147]